MIICSTQAEILYINNENGVLHKRLCQKLITVVLLGKAIRESKGIFFFLLTFCWTSSLEQVGRWRKGKIEGKAIFGYTFSLTGYLDQAGDVRFWASSRPADLAIDRTAEEECVGIQTPRRNFAEIIQFILGECGILVLYFSQSS